MVSAQKQIAEVLSGTADYSTMPWPLHSAIRLPIYNLACTVLAQPNKATRRATLDEVPETVRGLVEAEALRLHALRIKK